METERKAFIDAMRSVASSVTVVTTDGNEGRYGATVSAFCSVSADPPTILVCLNEGSRITQHVIANRKLNINVLPQNADHIAQRFAGAHDHEIKDRFDNIPLNTDDVPSIRGATVLSCEIDQIIPSGSHQIVIGKVKSVAKANNHPLTYYDGAYHQVTPLAVAAN